jgi:hypothetical protein
MGAGCPENSRPCLIVVGHVPFVHPTTVTADERRSQRNFEPVGSHHVRDMHESAWAIWLPIGPVRGAYPALADPTSRPFMPHAQRVSSRLIAARQ